MKDIEIKKDEFGPHVGDVSFTNIGTEFKPYIEWEWIFYRYGSVFAQAGYRIINGEKSVVAAVEPINDPLVKNRISERDESFFYSLSGFDLGIGISIIF